MNKLTQEQLNKVNFADLTVFDTNTNTYYIKKYSKPTYDMGNCYLVKVANNLINNTQSSLATNWNNGLAPSAEYYKVYVSKILGRMLYLDCLEYNYIAQKDGQARFSGWFDIDDLTQINKI